MLTRKYFNGRERGPFRSPFMLSHVRLTGPKDILEKLEPAIVDREIGNRYKYVLRPAPLPAIANSEPEVYRMDRQYREGKNLEQCRISPGVTVKIGQTRSQPLTSKKVARVYTFKLLEIDDKAISEYYAEELVAVDLDEWLRQKFLQPNNDGISSLGVTASPEPIFRLSHQPALSPAQLMPYEFDTNPDTINDTINPADAFKSQDCWKALRMGNNDQPVDDKWGEGTTVVILDAAPDPEIVFNSSLVDYFIPMKPDAVFISPDPSDLLFYYTMPELLALNPEKPASELRKFTKELNPDDMRKYHGLMIASLIRYLAPSARIILMEVFTDKGESSSALLDGALNYVRALSAPDAGALSREMLPNPEKLVINLSLGYPFSLEENEEVVDLKDACEQLCEMGAVLVAAAGNDSYYQHPRNPEEPAAYGLYNSRLNLFNQTIAVGAFRRESQEPVIYTNQSNLAAYGDYILMDSGAPDAIEGSRYVWWAGTSFATPLVAGSVAVLLSLNVDYRDMKNCLWQHSNKPENWADVPTINLDAAIKSCQRAT